MPEPGRSERRTGGARAWAVGLALLVGSVAGPARGEAGDAGPLLRLAPRDAGLTLIIQDLEGTVRDLGRAPWFRELAALPSVRGWMGSAEGLKLGKARREIEDALEAPIGRVGDALFGEAVVLALHVEEGRPPDEARGLLLTKVRDRALLDRLIEAANRSDREAGRLLEVLAIEDSGGTYHARRFRPGTKPAEWYAVLDGDVLAWSNSEALVRGAIARSRADRPEGLADHAEAVAVLQALATPGPSAARLLIDGAFLGRLLDANPPAADDPIGRAFHAYLRAVRYAGLSLTARDGLVLRSHQRLEASRLAEPVRRWAGLGGDVGPLLARVPADSTAVAAGLVDFRAAAAIARALAPEKDRPRLDLLADVARALLPGRDPDADVLGRIGPQVVAYLGRAEVAAEGKPRWPLVIGASLGEPALARAIDPAIRAALAMRALGAPAGRPMPRVVGEPAAGGSLIRLDAPGRSPAFAVTPQLLAAGTSAEAVARFVGAGAEAGGATARRPVEVGDAASFAYADLPALRAELERARPSLMRRWGPRHGLTEADLDQVLALITPFRLAYVTAALDRAAGRADQVAGLVAGGGAAAPIGPGAP